MILKGIVEEDFINYKKPSMFLAFPNCTFKCEKECGVRCCQNSELATSKNIEVSVEEIVTRYLQNHLTAAIVLGGLEPFDSFEDVLLFINELRKYTEDMVVIYTGYNENEVNDIITSLSDYKNIVIKFGRFVPNSESIFDSTLGIRLASKNQYAKQIS